MSTSVAIVTGASQGIGRSTAIRLARYFSSIVLAAREAMTNSVCFSRKTSPPFFSL